MPKRWQAALAAVGLGSFAQAQALPVPNVLDTASPQAAEIGTLFWWVMGLSVLVLVVVLVFLGAVIWRGWRERHRVEEPPQIHGNAALEVTWTVVPLALLGVLLVLTVASTFRLSGLSAPENALHVKVIGKQFWWEMLYPEEGIVTANELVVPLGRPVRLELVADDVMHSFWIPQLAGKTDMIPGQVRYLWFTADRLGIYYGQCAELCGDSHANMRLRAIVLTPEDYAAWVAAAQQAPPGPDTALAQQGSQLFASKGCIGCHAVLGRNTANRFGPDLSHIGSRTSIAAGVLPNNREAMVRWLMYPDIVKPGNFMPNLGLSEAEAEALAAYMETLTLPGFDLLAALRGDAPVNAVNEFGYPIDADGNPLPLEIALERP
jgi:cytochrome c oxidase subunit 2